MSAENLNELFVEELKDIYDAEKQLTKALPKLAKAANSPELRAAFEEHLETTRGHVQRCEEVFKLLGAPARGKTCEGMKGLIEEGDEAVKGLEGSTLDAALIAAAQKVEHYEIATYGTLATFAEVLEMQDAKDLLVQTLEEEKEADLKLTEIAETSINWEAEAGEGEQGEQDDQEDEGDMAMAGAPPRSAARGRTGTARGSGSKSGGTHAKKK